MKTVARRLLVGAGFVILVVIADAGLRQYYVIPAALDKFKTTVKAFSYATGKERVPTNNTRAASGESDQSYSCSSYNIAYYAVQFCHAETYLQGLLWESVDTMAVSHGVFGRCFLCDSLPPPDVSIEVNYSSGQATVSGALASGLQR